MRMILLVLVLVVVAVLAYVGARAGAARRRGQREREASARRTALAARERARAQQRARWDRQADDLSEAVTSVLPAINLPLLGQSRDDVPRAPAFRPEPPMTPASGPRAGRQGLPSHPDPAPRPEPWSHPDPAPRPEPSSHPDPGPRPEPWSHPDPAPRPEPSYLDPAADGQPPPYFGRPRRRPRPAADFDSPPPAFPPRPPMTPDFDPPRPARARTAFDPSPPAVPVFDPLPLAREPRPSIFEPASRTLPPRPAGVTDFELPRQPEAEDPWPPSGYPGVAHELTGSRAVPATDRGGPDRDHDRPSGHQGGRRGRHRSRS